MATRVLGNPADVCRNAAELLKGHRRSYTVDFGGLPARYWCPGGLPDGHGSVVLYHGQMQEVREQRQILLRVPARPLDDCGGTPPKTVVRCRYFIARPGVNIEVGFWHSSC